MKRHIFLIGTFLVALLSMNMNAQAQQYNTFSGDSGIYYNAGLVINSLTGIPMVLGQKHANSQFHDKYYISSLTPPDTFQMYQTNCIGGASTELIDIFSINGNAVILGEFQGVPLLAKISPLGATMFNIGFNAIAILPKAMATDASFATVVGNRPDGNVKVARFDLSTGSFLDSISCMYQWNVLDFVEDGTDYIWLIDDVAQQQVKVVRMSSTLQLLQSSDSLAPSADRGKMLLSGSAIAVELSADPVVYFDELDLASLSVLMPIQMFSHAGDIYDMCIVDGQGFALTGTLDNAGMTSVSVMIIDESGQLIRDDQYSIGLNAIGMGVISTPSGILICGLTNGTDLFTLLVINPLSAEEKEESDLLFEAYPNPFVDKITIRPSEDGIITFSDIEGRKLLEQKVQKGRNMTLMLDACKPGTYLLSLKNGAAEYVKKMIR